MKGVISFHPVDPGFVETMIDPLMAGRKIDPEGFLDAACRARRVALTVRRYKLALEMLLVESEPPPPPPTGGTLWERMRGRLDRFDHRPSALARLAASTIEPELHLRGRPFLIAGGSARQVATIVQQYVVAEDENRIVSLVIDQLGRIDPRLAQGVELQEVADPGHEAAYRNELLCELRAIHELVHAHSRAPERVLDLPWRIVRLHGRAVPFWIGDDVDGLDTVCQAAGMATPPFVGTAERLLPRVCEQFPGLSDGFRPEMDGTGREIGAYVAPSDIPDLLAFLAANGARIIRAAAGHGEGPACKRLLLKMRECARFAEANGTGYLEASGIHPLLEDPVEDLEESCVALSPP